MKEPFTPKTNGMVERVNRIIEVNKYEDLEQMETNLYGFLQTYNFVRRHSGLRKELNLKTPLNAVHKWYELEPELFKENPVGLKIKL